MKHLIFLIIGYSILFPFSVSSQNAAPGKQVQCAIRGSYGLGYLLYLPKDYKQNDTRKWPLILFLHGSGERGTDLNSVKTWGPPRIAEEKGLPFIVVSPQCPEKDEWISILSQVRDLLDTVIAKYNVDTSRIYLTGLSMGGYGAFTMAQIYPGYFAAVAPVCGGGIPSLAKFVKPLPTWVFHGADDPVVPLSAAQLMVEALQAEKGEVKFTVYPGVGHDAWIPAYNDTSLYSWLLIHHKTK